MNSSAGRIRGRFLGGRLTVGESLKFEDLVPPSIAAADSNSTELYPFFENFLTLPVSSAGAKPGLGLFRHRGWFYEYRINVSVNKTCQLLFIDETDDKYQLTVLVGGYDAFSHSVEFNSSRPNIKAFEIDIPR